MIDRAIDALTDHYQSLGLLGQLDREYCRNRAFSLLQEEPVAYQPSSIDRRSALQLLLQAARDKGLLAGEGVAFEDDFIARLTDLFMPRPSEYTAIVANMPDAKAATDWMYRVAVDTDYVKSDRVKNNIHHRYQAEYAQVEITINVSKPEKSPEEIRLASTASAGYPACLLCRENVGLSDVPRPPRAHHRIYPISLNGEDYFFQYSPYSYFNEHCIIFSGEHRPMAITQAVVDRFLDFVDQFPHYFISANADLPIVGGSILTHDHYQGGRALFPIDASPETILSDEAELRVARLDWPISAVRLSGQRAAVAGAAKRLIEAWRDYSKPEFGILAKTDRPHNTVNLLARRGEDYQLTLLFRNNRTDQAHPDGIFHTRPIWQVVKRENIGIIEAIGLAILPARLVTEMAHFEELEQYRDWLRVVPEAEPLERLGYTFSEILKDCGVFKQDEASQQAFEDFLRVAYEND